MKQYRAKNNRAFMNHSHLKKHLQKQSVQNLIMGIGGTIVLLFVMFTYGPDLLIKLSLLFNKPSQNQTTHTTTDDSQYIEPPTIDPMFESTNSASVTIQGEGVPQQTIKLYLNGNFADQTTVNSEKKFSFSNITLDKGPNEFKTKSVTDNKKESDYSSPITITYRDKAPSLDITSPQDGQTLSKGSSPIKVTGKTDNGARVTVNDFWAIMNGDGTFSYLYSLQDGDNTIKITATDDANNKTEKEIKIKVE